MREPLVLVRWEDASFTLEDTGDRACYMSTVGWLLSDTPRAIRVAGERAGTGHWRGVTRIPRALVRSVTLLYQGEPA